MLVCARILVSSTCNERCYNTMLVCGWVVQVGGWVGGCYHTSRCLTKRVRVKKSFDANLGGIQICCLFLKI